MKQLIAILFAIFAFTATAQSLTAVPDNLYVVGLLTAGDKIDYDGIEFNRDGNIFSLENVSVYTETGESSQYHYPIFGLVYNKTPNSTTYGWLGVGNNYSNPQLSTETSSQIGLLNSGSKSRWIRIDITDPKIPSDPVHVNLVVDFADLAEPTLTVSLYTEHISTGVDDIRIEDGEVQWYTTSGIKVETPSAGLYIRRQNGETKLVHVK